MRIAAAVVILLLLCGYGICAESQQPTPSGPKSDTHQVKNTEHPQKTTEVLPQSTPEIRPSASVLTKPEPQTTKNQKADQSLSDWCLVILTAILAFATYRLVVQTRRLVNETVLASERQATETQNALELSRRAAAAAEKAAEHANESNKLSRDAMVAQQRPWISVDVEIASPLAYDDAGWDAGIRWHIALKYRLHHLGKTPATNVSFFGEIIPFTISHWPANMVKDGIPQGVPIDGTDVAKEIETVCSFPESMSKFNMGFGQLLFPDESKVGLFGLNGNPARFEEAKTNQGYGGQFLIVVCATYESTFNREPYRTAKAFLLHKLTGNQRIGLNGEIIPMYELGFTPHPQQIGSYAS